jgi:hypothetical protein
MKLFIKQFGNRPVATHFLEDGYYFTLRKKRWERVEIYFAFAENKSLM